jgi:hypothetical protein
LFAIGKSNLRGELIEKIEEKTPRDFENASS